MSRPQVMWKNLTAPWLAPLLRQVVLCRVLVAVVAVLGVAQVLGWSLWPCFFADITGRPCPGCGMTRAMVALLRGEWREALALHSFAPGFVALGACVLFAAAAPARWRQALLAAVERFEAATRIPTLFLLAVLIYGLLRMGGLCSNHAVVKPTPTCPPLRERWSGGR